MVSVIVPIYNAEEYLQTCIESILMQTYTNFELLLIDDGSIDQSLSICHKYAFSDKRIKVFQKENGGASSARNFGINQAIGKFLLFIDSDDWIVPECIAKMVECYEKHAQSQIVFAGATASDGSWKCLDYTSKNFPEFSDDDNWLCLSMLKRFVFGMMPWNKLILRDFVIKNNLYFVEGTILEDEIWNFDISKHIKAASFVNSNLYFYNLHPNSVMSKASEAFRQERLFVIWNILISRIGGKRKKLQIRGVYKYMYEEAPKNLSIQKKFMLSSLYFKLGLKSCDMFSLRLFYNSLKALC